MINLPDVNVWLALAFSAHQHHVAAKTWFESDATACAFCRMTQQGFLRLATHPKVLGPDAVSLADAWKLYDRILQDPRLSYVDEPSGIEGTWRLLTSTGLFSPKVWNDAFLAAFAIAGDFRLVTFDRALAQTPALSVKLLSG